MGQVVAEAGYLKVDVSGRPTQHDSHEQDAYELFAIGIGSERRQKAFKHVDRGQARNITARDITALLPRQLAKGACHLTSGVTDASRGLAVERPHR